MTRSPQMRRRLALHALGRPIAAEARRMSARALRGGALSRPDACGKCGRVRAGWPVQAHHESYLNPLDVQWLCSGCHAERHCVLRRERRDPLGVVGRLVHRNLLALMALSSHPNTVATGDSAGEVSR